MTFQDYKFVVDFTTYQVAEESQQCNVRFVPLVVLPEKEEVHITTQAFKCREFMQDWQWFCLTGVTGEVYDMAYDSFMLGWQCGMSGLTHMGMVSDSPSERKILEQMAVESVQLPSPVEDKRDGSYNELFILEIPEYVRDRPLGLALWTGGVRGQVEADTTENVHPIFGWPSEPSGKLFEFTNSIEDVVSVSDYLEFCSDEANLFRIDPNNPDHCHDELSYVHHEGFSPVSMITQAKWQKDQEYDPDRYDSEIDALSAYQVELLKRIIKE